MTKQFMSQEASQILKFQVTIPTFGKFEQVKKSVGSALARMVRLAFGDKAKVRFDERTVPKTRPVVPTEIPSGLAADE